MSEHPYMAPPRLPVWSCGHEHATRGEAVECLRRQREQRPVPQDDPGDSDAA